MRSLKKYLVWNAGRPFSRQLGYNRYYMHRIALIQQSNQHNHDACSQLFQNIIEWNENGSLFTNLQYNHLQTLFDTDNGSKFFNLFINDFNYNASKLLSYAKYAPQTHDGNQLLIQLMHQFANIGDYESCSIIFKWICEDFENKTISIDYYNILLKAIYSTAINANNNNEIILKSFDIWCDIKESPISFNSDTIFYLLNILKSNKNHLKHFVDDIFNNYNAVISMDVNIIIHLLPFINDINTAFTMYKNNLHLDTNTNTNKLSLSMLENIINNIDSFKNDNNLINSYIMEIINNYSPNVNNHKSIANIVRRICLLPMDKKTKYKFDDNKNILNIFEGKYNNHYFNYLLDNAFNMNEIELLCNEYGDLFNAHNLYNMVHQVINVLKLHSKNNELNHKFISFVMNNTKELIPNMTFNDSRIALKLLSILDKHIINNNKLQFVSMIESIQKHMISLFTSHQNEISAKNNPYGHRVIVYNIDEIIGIISAFTKNRAYNEPLLNYLCEQIVINIQINNPQYSSNITYFDAATKHRKANKNIAILLPVYTSILRHLRYLNFYQKKLYSLIASSLQKRPDIIKINELREWCLAFGAMNHNNNSIWLSIQSIILNYYPNTSTHTDTNMDMDLLIDFIWSMAVNDLIPNHWLIPQLIQLLNDKNESERVQNLSFIHKTRLWEIFQSLYANPICYESLNQINVDVIESLQEFYDEYVVPQFHQQCKLRPALYKFCKFLNDKQINYEIGQSVGNMLALCDIIIPQYKICIEVFDYPHITKRSQNRTREWVKFKARRQITRRLLENTEKKWHFILVNGVDPKYDMDAFANLMRKFIYAQRLKDQCIDIGDNKDTNARIFGVNLNLA